MALNKESILNEYLCKILELPGNCVVSDTDGRIYVLSGKQLLELANVYHNHLDKAQDRIKELEDVLRFYAERKHIIIQLGEIQTVNIEDGTTARKLLEKESE